APAIDLKAAQPQDQIGINSPPVMMYHIDRPAPGRIQYVLIVGQEMLLVLARLHRIRVGSRDSQIYPIAPIGDQSPGIVGEGDGDLAQPRVSRLRVGAQKLQRAATAELLRRGEHAE